MNISKIEENNIYTYTEKNFFESVDFSHPMLIEVEDAMVYFNFPSTRATERRISKMEDSITKSFFEEILRRMKEEAAVYYKNNPGILELHIGLGLGPQ